VKSAAIGHHVHQPIPANQQHLIAGVAQLEQRLRVAPDRVVNQIGHGRVAVHDLELRLGVERLAEGGGAQRHDHHPTGRHDHAGREVTHVLEVERRDSVAQRVAGQVKRRASRVDQFDELGLVRPR
jgi:hypothetical protein